MKNDEQKQNKNLVKYHNDLNLISMHNRTANDMNFFFAIISKIRDKGCKDIDISTEEIKEMIDFNDKNKRWIKILQNIADKIINLYYIEKTSHAITYFNLFQRFKIDIDNKTVSLKVTEDFEYIVNKLTKNFTVYELKEFTSLKSTYSKSMYRIIKQRRTVGKKEIEIQQFRDLLDIPQGYTIGQINNRIIKQIKKELPQYFDNFDVEIIKAKTQGTPVVGYRFTWTPEQVPEKPAFVTDNYIKAEDKRRKLSKVKKNGSSSTSFTDEFRKKRAEQIRESQHLEDDLSKERETKLQY